jgi:hypothetical protein
MKATDTPKPSRETSTTTRSIRFMTTVAAS